MSVSKSVLVAVVGWAVSGAAWADDRPDEIAYSWTALAFDGVPVPGSGMARRSALRDALNACPVTRGSIGKLRAMSALSAGLAAPGTYLVVTEAMEGRFGALAIGGAAALGTSIAISTVTPTRKKLVERYNDGC
jgi:hypothetical protein